MKGHTKHLDHLNMTVADLDESLAWYDRVFGFEAVEQGLYQGRRWAIVRAGDAMLCLYEHPDRRAVPNRDRDTHGLSHFGLRVTDRAAWEATLGREGLPLLYGGERRYPRSTSWYVADPTGHEIEIVLWDDDTVRFA